MRSILSAARRPVLIAVAVLAAGASAAVADSLSKPQVGARVMGYVSAIFDACGQEKFEALFDEQALGRFAQEHGTAQRDWMPGGQYHSQSQQGEAEGKADAARPGFCDRPASFRKPGGYDLSALLASAPTRP